jgi:hypothetical protein
MGEQIPFTLEPTEVNQRLIVDIEGIFRVRNTGMAYFSVVSRRPESGAICSRTIDAGCEDDIRLKPDVAGLIIENPINAKISGWYEYIGPA